MAIRKWPATGHFQGKCLEKRNGPIEHSWTVRRLTNPIKEIWFGPDRLFAYTDAPVLPSSRHPVLGSRTCIDRQQSFNELWAKSKFMTRGIYLESAGSPSFSCVACSSSSTWSVLSAEFEASLAGTADRAPQVAQLVMARNTAKSLWLNRTSYSTQKASNETNNFQNGWNSARALLHGKRKRIFRDIGTQPRLQGRDPAIGG